MTPDEKKAYLRKAYRLDKVIKSQAAELQVLRAALSSIGGGGGDGMPHGYRHDGTIGEITNIVRAVDLEAKLQEEIRVTVAKWKEIHETVERLKNLDEKLIIRMRYIEGRNWDEIAAELHFSRSAVFKVHDSAIDNLEPPEDSIVFKVRKEKTKVD